MKILFCPKVFCCYCIGFRKKWVIVISMIKLHEQRSIRGIFRCILLPSSSLFPDYFVNVKEICSDSDCYATNLLWWFLLKKGMKFGKRITINNINITAPPPASNRLHKSKSCIRSKRRGRSWRNQWPIILLISCRFIPFERIICVFSQIFTFNVKNSKI